MEADSPVSAQATSGAGTSNMSTLWSALDSSATGSPAKSDVQSLTSTHSPIPAAAIAIPVILVGIGVIALASILISLIRRRLVTKRMKRQRAPYMDNDRGDKYTSFAPLRSSVGRWHTRTTSRDVESGLPPLPEKCEFNLPHISASTSHSWEAGMVGARAAL